MAMLAGANSAHSWRWIDYFVQRGHEIHWISLVPFPRAPRPELSSYVVPVAPRGVFGLLRAGGAVRRILAGIGPQLLHVHSVGSYGVVGALSGARPMMATAWGSDVLLAARAPGRRMVIRGVLGRAALVTCDALHMREALLRLGVPPAKIRVIYFGTDPTRFHPGVDGSYVRARFGLRDGPVIISLRSLEPIYDVATLVRSLGLTETVRLAGPVSAEEIPAFLTAADIYVSTARSDAGLAASTAEAMASELPVVVTACAENHLWVAEGRGGYLTPLGDADALARRILDLAHRPDLRKAFGTHNRQVIEERNNYFREMAKIESLYQDLAAAHGAADRTRGG